MAERLYICDHYDATDHCSKHCYHGISPHPAEGCTKIGYCDIVNEPVRCKPTRCKPATATQIAALEWK